MDSYTHIIWDFNGTILNDAENCLRAANELLRRHGLPPMADIEAYREVFGFPIIDYYRRIGFDFDRVSFAELAPEWVELYRRYSADATVFPQIPAVLQTLRERGIGQYILSATNLEMLEEQVAFLGIRSYFDGLLGLDNIHAQSKTHLAVQWREQHPQARVLFVGDTEHDAQTAAAMGADCILLACGHRPRRALEECGALFVFRDAGEIPLNRLFPPKNAGRSNKNF